MPLQKTEETISGDNVNDSETISNSGVSDQSTLILGKCEDESVHVNVHNIIYEEDKCITVSSVESNVSNLQTDANRRESESEDTEMLAADSLRNISVASSVIVNINKDDENIERKGICNIDNIIKSCNKLNLFSKGTDLMPQDIQQIVLGDLKEVRLGQCNEFIDNDEDSNWDDDGVIEDTVTCEEGEMETESQLTEDEVLDNNTQTVKSSTLNDCTTEKEKINHSETSTKNISIKRFIEGQDVYEYSQGGSYEIITVSKESDCEYSQESDIDDYDMEMQSRENLSVVLGVNDCYTINISHDDEENDSDNNSNTAVASGVNDVQNELHKHYDRSGHNSAINPNDVSEYKIKEDLIDSTIKTKNSLRKGSSEKVSKVRKNSNRKVISDDGIDGKKLSSALSKSSNDEATIDSTVPDSKNVDSFAIFQTINSIIKDSKEEPSSTKNRLLKTEEEKRSSFRSRSGSSDTTGSGSESGSTSSSSHRRSGRNKTTGGSKQSSEKTHGKNSNSLTSSPILAAPAVPSFDNDKPVKVKSRWRRSSELEMGSRVTTDSSSLTVSSTTTSVNEFVTAPSVAITTSSTITSTLTEAADTTSNEAFLFSQPAPANTSAISSPSGSSTPQWQAADTSSPKQEIELEEKLRAFVHIDCNEYLTGRSRSKETKRMVCDCFLTKEELQRGEKGCGEDCLNRLLMIECGSRCVLGENCTNKRFQNLDYVNSEVFKTKKKGYGLRAVKDIPVGSFILEYVGEVLDPKEFRRRAKDYAKVKNLHYYFMALKSDAIIDATVKGNNSRFINHSCDPNAETQKWTVNGELRIGFFSNRSISAGEEITFDYQLQRYGKEAQRCYCESASCRGWIGEDPNKEGKWSDSGNRKERKEKKKKREVKDLLNDMDLEEEIEKLVSSGLKNRAHTLTLCRLMVRAEEPDSRRRLLKLLRHGDTACLRLFLDYHGLRLVWSWMMDSDFDLKLEILETLSKLPIPNKTMLQDSKVLTVVEKWASGDKSSLKRKERSQSEDDSETIDTEVDSGSGDSEKMTVDTSSVIKEDKIDIDKVIDNDEETKIEGEVIDATTDVQKSEPSLPADKPQHLEKFKGLAGNLLSEWSALKEVFRIPKKERIEQMKEHEREADRGYRERSRDDKRDRHYDRRDRYSSDYDRRDRDRDRDRYRDRDKDRKRSRESPDHDRPSKRVDDKNTQKLSKNERRQLFMMKVEEEDRQKKQQEEMWQQHQDQCMALGLDPNNTAVFDPQTGYPCFFDNNTQTWQPYPSDPNVQHPEGKMDQTMYPPPVSGGPVGFNSNQPPPPFSNGPSPFVDTSQPPPPFIDPNQPPPFVDTSQPPPFIDTSQPPPFINPTQGPFQPPPGPVYPNFPGPGFPMHDNSGQFPSPIPPQPQFSAPPPFHNAAPPFVQSSGYPSPVPQSQPFQQMPMGAPFPPPTQTFTPQFQPPLPQSPSVNQQIPNDTSLQYQPVIPQNTTNNQVPVTTVDQTQGFPTETDSTTNIPMFGDTAVATTPLIPPAIRLPPKWKSVKDSEGRVYYYHVKTRMSQWEPPSWDQQPQPQQSESSSESDDDSEEDSSSTSEDDEEEKNDEENEEEAENDDAMYPMEDVFDIKDDIEPSSIDEFSIVDEPSGTSRLKRDGLVQERIISPRTEFEMEKTDKKKYREIKEKLRRQKAKLKEKLRLHEEKKHSRRHSKLKTSSKCEADTSSDPARKIKDNFRLNMAGVIVHYLNPYRKPDCKLGRITNTEDFKHLARKLTHFVMLKELKHCRSVDELECNDNVKHKARDFIKKYMSKFGSVYQRLQEDD